MNAVFVPCDKWSKDLCAKCCHQRKPSCRTAKCRKHERCDGKVGYYVEEKE